MWKALKRRCRGALGILSRAWLRIVTKQLKCLVALRGLGPEARCRLVSRLQVKARSPLSPPRTPLTAP